MEKGIGGVKGRGQEVLQALIDLLGKDGWDHKKHLLYLLAKLRTIFSSLRGSSLVTSPLGAPAPFSKPGWEPQDRTRKRMARAIRKDAPREDPGNEENYITYFKDSLILFGS